MPSAIANLAQKFDRNSQKGLMENYANFRHTHTHTRYIWRAKKTDRERERETPKLKHRIYKIYIMKARRVSKNSLSKIRKILVLTEYGCLG